MALSEFRTLMGREPYDSEVVSRAEIQTNPPDVLMTNYQMLELILTRFDDKTLFPPAHRGTLRLFGEPFEPVHVIGERYALPPLPEHPVLPPAPSVDTERSGSGSTSWLAEPVRGLPGRLVRPPAALEPARS